MGRIRHLLGWGVALAALGAVAQPEEPPLRPDLQYTPGQVASPWLRYQDPVATNVALAGAWDGWAGRWGLDLSNGVWTLDTRRLPAPIGPHEYKFVVNDEWEPGANRLLFLGEDRLLELPSDLIFSATIEDSNTVDVVLRQPPAPGQPLRVRLSPEAPLLGVRFSSDTEDGMRRGYFVRGSMVTFVFDEALYDLRLTPTDRVVVAGNFNGWDSGGDRWRLQNVRGEGRWELTTQLGGLRPPGGQYELLFKFVINGQRWLMPSPQAPNARAEPNGNRNLLLDPLVGSGASARLVTREPLDLSQPYVVLVDGLRPRPVWQPLTPGGVFDKIYSAKPLGAVLDPAHGCTTYRVFAPRARRVYLCLFPTPYYEVFTPQYQRLKPAERYLLWRDPADSVWEITLLGLDAGRYYSFNVEGPGALGEGFNSYAQVGDPYARAAAHAENNTIVVDPEATNAWFGGWTDAGYRAPAHADMVIYEMHMRDMTAHPSAGVPAPLRGTFAGLLATEGRGTGLDHLRDLGVNMLELLPIAEFNNGVNDYSWGYSTAFFFAPEASYGQAPLKGSAYYEFKHLVDRLHGLGFGVILDVVYNHIGWPNVFSLLDKKYFFRLNPDFSYSNYSGCGNDVRTESPMMRRLITDNIVYWMREHHVDGFRFDLAELIDMDTLRAIRQAALQVNTNVILISEPWSLRGENKHQLKGTGWSAWNNDFRYAAKDFAMGRRNRDWLAKQIGGSVDTWTANPLQSINEIERHDDMALTDEFSTRPDRDGTQLQERDVAANRLAATILFTSLGIPMINNGQEFLRSKRGLNNTFDRGDAINAVRWTDRERPLAAEALAYYRDLILLRRSPAGAAFRVSQRPPPQYLRWLLPDNPQALGYVVNAPRIHAGAGFVVLLNAGADPVTFLVDFPPGRWRQVGDGKTLRADGLPGAANLDGGRRHPVTAPPLAALIFQDGF